MVVHYATVLWWSSTPRSSDSLLLLCRWTTTCPRGPSTTTVAAVSATGGGAARGGGGPGTPEYDEAVLIRGEDFMKMTMWTWFGDDHDAYKSKYKYDYVSGVIRKTSACTPHANPAVTPMYCNTQTPCILHLFAFYFSPFLLSFCMVCRGPAHNTLRTNKRATS
jgi:hypothetical protein